jgi:hypothetical protein
MDESYREKLLPYIVKYREYSKVLKKIIPYGVPIGLGNWAGSGSIVNFGTTICFASRYFPRLSMPVMLTNHQLAVWLPSLPQLLPRGGGWVRSSKSGLLW